MTAQEETYVNALVAALSRDLVQHPPPGLLARVVIRWFQNVDPLGLDVHALGTHEEADVDPDDAWYPLEWPNVDREEERGARIMADEVVQAAGADLAEQYAELEDMEEGEWRASPALVEVSRRAPAALRAAGVPVADHLLVLAAHVEGGGALHVMEQVAPPQSVLVALEEHDALPDE